MSDQKKTSSCNIIMTSKSDSEVGLNPLIPFISSKRDDKSSLMNVEITIKAMKDNTKKKELLAIETFMGSSRATPSKESRQKFLSILAYLMTWNALLSDWITFCKSPLVTFAVHASQKREFGREQKAFFEWLAKGDMANKPLPD